MAPVLASGQKPQTKYKGRAFGLELGSAAADGWRLAPGCGTHGTPIRCRSELVGFATPIYHDLGHHETLCCATTSPSCNSRRQILKDVIDVCDNFVNELEAHCRILSVSEERYTQNSVAAYADACCSAAAEWKEPAAQENGNTTKETTKGPRLGPDHLPEEPALVTFQRGLTFWVRGLIPTFSRRSTVSQRLRACGSVASGALRSFLSATCGTPCEKTKPTEVTNR